jgi:hypothetical protein
MFDRKKDKYQKHSELGVEKARVSFQGSNPDLEQHPAVEDWFANDQAFRSLDEEFRSARQQGQAVDWDKYHLLCDEYSHHIENGPFKRYRDLSDDYYDLDHLKKFIEDFEENEVEVEVKPSLRKKLGRLSLRRD